MRGIGAVLCMWVTVAMSGSSARAQGGAPPVKSTWLVVYRPGPSWLVGKPLGEQPLKEHGRYMLSLYTEGTLKMAGPFLDDTGGAVVFEAAGDAEARAVVAADPAVASQVFVAELHPWRPVDWERHVRK